ncbi:MAG TPA: phage holin family protein [Chthoniobacteraceae bacterium]|nr:phage holin family protein [Chthoniobacteraceae bacterium]
MTDHVPETRSRGIFANAAGLLAAFVRYFKARMTLLGIEAKEAGINYGVAAAIVVLALFLAVLAYVFLIITAVFGIAALFDGRNAWIGVMGAAAVLHAGGAAVLVFLALRRFKAGAFPVTLEELSKDQQWLTKLSSNH